MVSSIIDMTEVYYDYQQNNEKELIDIKKWNEVIDKFIHNKPVVKRKKKKKVLTEEEIGNLNFDLNSPIDEEYSKNYTEYEISEMRDYVWGVFCGFLLYLLYKIIFTICYIYFMHRIIRKEYYIHSQILAN